MITPAVCGSYIVCPNTLPKKDKRLSPIQPYNTSKIIDNVDRFLRLQRSYPFLIKRKLNYNVGSATKNQSIPFQQLQVLWTLFSECFSSFPCGTFALSVSCEIFSLRWSIPPNLSCTLKQLDSPNTRILDLLVVTPAKPLCQLVFSICLRGFHPLCRPVPRNLDRNLPISWLTCVS